MEDQQIGWFAAIIIGGLAGWIAEKLMKNDQGVFMNILYGIVGAFIASVLMSALGIMTSGWFGYLIAGVVGACMLIAAIRLIRGQKI